MPTFGVGLATFAGASANTQGLSWNELESFVLRAEALGYRDAWIADHLVLGGAGGEFEVWTALAALAARTSTIRLGPLVLAVTHRNPALLAKMTATLDYLSGGRVNLGIGAGWHQAEQQAYGLGWVNEVGERMDRLDEALTLVRALFTDGTLSFEGRYYHVRDARCQPAPIQKPWPPIWVGGGGERRTLRIVARHADAWNIPAVSPETYRHKLSVLAEHCQAERRDYREIEKTMETCALVIDGSVAKRRSWEAKLARWLNGRRKDSGEPELTERQAVRHIRETYVVGSAEECRTKLAAYEEIGVQHFTPYFLDYPEDGTLESLPGLLG